MISDEQRAYSKGYYAGRHKAKQQRSAETIRRERVDKRDKLLLLTKDALVKVLGWIDDCADTSPEYCFDPVEAQANEALAAINDSKAVEGLILCEQDLNYQVGDIITYAPRRTEK